MRPWLDPPDTPTPGALRAAAGGHPLVAETLARRGFADPAAARAFLDPDCYTPAPPADLPGVLAAAERLERALRAGERICVWGDFDVDGQTAAALLVSALRGLGGEVFYHIPVLARESHGVKLPALREALDAGAQLLLTCDTGVDAAEALDYARSRGVETIVTDHHTLPPALPPAVALVHPGLLPPGHPLATLPGVGVAFKLAEALLGRAGRAVGCEALLDLVALGIVADVAAQTGDARYLLQRGLAQLRRTTRPGLLAIFERAELDPASLSEEHIGFQLAPRLNALGRLDDAGKGVQLLLTPDVTRARTLALELEGLNARRKLLTGQIFQSALAQLARDPALEETAALVLAHPEWEAGVLGIVAARLVDRFHKPAVLLTCPPGGPARGSARSVPGCDITAALAAHADLLASFGGHPMAAGLSLDPERIPELRRALSRGVAEATDGAPPAPPLQIDGYLSLADLTLELVAEIERLAPFGPGNPALTLATRALTLKSRAALGRHGDHLALTVEDEQGVTQRVLRWNGAGEPLPEGRFDLAYNLRASSSGGRREVQVTWLAARAVAEAPAAVAVRAPLEVLDYRREPHPLPLLRQLPGPLALWFEGGGRAPEGLPAQPADRGHLAPAETLVIWTAPPGPEELRSGLEAVAPARVALVGALPAEPDRAGEFLTRLAGLVKYALRALDGEVTLPALAAATGQRASTVRAGLAWLEAAGHLRLLEEDGDRLLLAGATPPALAPDLSQLSAVLRALLAETAAYRETFRRAPAETLL